MTGAAGPGAIETSDEWPHPSPGRPHWHDAWLLDLIDPRLKLAASIELVLWPDDARVAFHVSVVRPGQSLVSLVEFDAAAPKTAGLEIRAPGLWTEIGIQTPLDHMTVDLEAFAVALEDPEDIFRGAYGHRIAIGSELEWETAADLRPGPQATSYEVPCVVHGELLIGADVIEIDGWGWRSHRWGVAGRPARTAFRGRTAAGDWVSDTVARPDMAMGVVGEAPVPEPVPGDDADTRLRQFFVATETGDCGWLRRTEMA